MRIDTKTALLNSAEQAARRRGFDGFSYADLAEDVGIRKASIHHHFPTKAALSVALMQRYAAEIRQALNAIDATHPSGCARLAALIDHYRGALNGGKSLCLCVSFSTSRDSLPADVITEIRSFRQMVIGWLTQTFELGRSDGTIAGVTMPDKEAAATLPLLEGAQLTARAQENLDLFENGVQLLRERLANPS